MTGRTRRAPHRASANSPIRNANAIAIDRTISPAALLLAEDGLQEREVEREEHVLDDDDPEDHPGLGVGRPGGGRG